jgi:hypothetical protein
LAHGAIQHFVYSETVQQLLVLNEYTSTGTLPSPGSRSTLHLTYDLAGNPAAIKVTGLRLDLLPVNIAVPRPRIEGEVVLYVDEAFVRLCVAPDTVLDLGRSGAWNIDVPVCCRAFPLTIGGMA